MQTARVIVCERTGRWAAVLRAMAPTIRAALCETRGLPECDDRLRESPASLLVIEYTAVNYLSVCRWLSSRTARFGQMHAVVVADPAIRAADCVFRTAGAHHLVDSPLRLTALRRWIEQHLDQSPRSKPSIRQWTWARMPWPTRDDHRDQM